MKRSPLRRYTPLRSRSPLRQVAGLRRAGQIAKVSEKRTEQMRAYRPLRDAFLAANPWCQSPWPCGNRSTEVHHRRGREGDRLLDTAWWAASCRLCNEKAETDTAAALALGWLIRTIGTTP